MLRQEVSKFYRNLIVGGFILLLLSFIAIHFVQSGLLIHKSRYLACADAELSSIAVLSGNTPVFSSFKWEIQQNASLPLDRIVNVIRNNPYQENVLLSSSVSFLEGKKVILQATAKEETPVYALYSQLTHFLNTPVFTDKEKQQLLSELSCLSVQATDYSGDSKLGVEPVSFVEGGDAFVWYSATLGAQLIEVKSSSRFSITILITAIVLFSLMIMLVLIWRELSNLEGRRQTFESVTRQIARGRIGLPEGLPDSSGTLKELAYSFDSMSSHIQRLLKVQREMINAISHELRTPIARLRFGLEVIKDDIDPAIHSTIEALEGDVEELNNLVDEVLTYGKLEEGSLALKFHETELEEMIQSILQSNASLLQHLDVKTYHLSNAYVSADVHHLHRALQNLILNGAKYASSTLSITFLQDDERWQLDVEDDGPGIAFEDRDKVFIPFQRLDNSRTRSSGGYGLGLAIVQRIAFWHGGVVLVDGSELGGAKFSFIWSRSQHQKILS